MSSFQLSADDRALVAAELEASLEDADISPEQIERALAEEIRCWSRGCLWGALMTEKFSELPDWAFSIEEVSAGVYEVIGTDGVGHRVQAKGVDPDVLLAECRRDAAKLGAHVIKP